MPDMEKVIRGLKVHGDPKADCDECPYRNEDSPGYGCLENLCNDAISLLKEQKSLINFLNHQREKGHWIFGDSNGHSWMKCSQCLVSQNGQTACFSFCPNCGASMEEEPEHMT